MTVFADIACKFVHMWTSDFEELVCHDYWAISAEISHTFRSMFIFPLYMIGPGILLSGRLGNRSISEKLCSEITFEISDFLDNKFELVWSPRIVYVTRLCIPDIV